MEKHKHTFARSLSSVVERVIPEPQSVFPQGRRLDSGRDHFCCESLTHHNRGLTLERYTLGNAVGLGINWNHTLYH